VAKAERCHLFFGGRKEIPDALAQLPQLEVFLTFFDLLSVSDYR
jgi:hypothetical protein